MANTTGTNMTVGLPNPFTPMAFLPPEFAFQTTISAYIAAGAVGAFVWDILTNIPNDYKLLFKYRTGLSTVVYFFSRIAALGYVLGAAILETAPSNHCNLVQTVTAGFFTSAVSSTCFIFFLRIRAVFDRSKIIVGFFFVVWLSVVGGAATVIVAVKSGNIGPTKYCIETEIKSYASAAGIAPLIHDTLVFTAISIRLLMNSPINFTTDWRRGGKAFLTGRYLPGFSRALLQNGQVYYMFTVGSNLLTVLMVYVGNIPVPYRTMFTMPNIMLTNAMACRVYRNVKFGLTQDISMSSLMTRSTTQAGSIPLPLRKDYSQREGSDKGGVIEVSKIVEFDSV